MNEYQLAVKLDLLNKENIELRGERKFCKGEMEKLKSNLAVCVKALKVVLKDYYDGSPDSSVGNALAVVESALKKISK